MLNRAEWNFKENVIYDGIWKQKGNKIHEGQHKGPHAIINVKEQFVSIKKPNNYSYFILLCDSHPFKYVSLPFAFHTSAEMKHALSCDIHVLFSFSKDSTIFSVFSFASNRNREWILLRMMKEGMEKFKLKRE